MQAASNLTNQRAEARSFSTSRGMSAVVVHGHLVASFVTLKELAAAELLPITSAAGHIQPTPSHADLTLRSPDFWEQIRGQIREGGGDLGAPSLEFDC